MTEHLNRLIQDRIDEDSSRVREVMPPASSIRSTAERRRRQSHMKRAVVSGLAIAVVGGAVLRGGLAAGDTSKSNQVADDLTVTTSVAPRWELDPAPGFSAMISQHAGRLQFTADGCPFLVQDSAAPQPVAFDSPLTVGKSPSGLFELVDSAGAIWGVENSVVDFAEIDPASIRLTYATSNEAVPATPTFEGLCKVPDATGSDPIVVTMDTRPSPVGAVSDES